MPKSIVKRKMMENDRLLETKNKNNLKLAPETMRIRDAIIEKYSETPLNRLQGGGIQRHQTYLLNPPKNRQKSYLK